MEETMTNGVVEANASNPVEETSTSNYRKIIAGAIANGCKRINNLKIKNVNVTEKDNYTMVSFTLMSNVPGYVPDEDGNYVKGSTNIIYTSLFAISGAFKENEELGWVANTIGKNPNLLNLLLNGATVSVLQQEVEAGKPVVNPFSSNTEDNELVYDHDVIVNHIIDFKLGKVGLKMLDKVADKMIDISL